MEPTMATTVMPEPQSALTRKFTEPEWEALKEMRTNLPMIFAEAFGKEEAVKESVTVWGVVVDPNRLDAKASVVLVHFLRAWALNVADATKAFIETLQWIRDFKPELAMKEEFPEEVFGKAGHIFGNDKDGRPVTYNIYGGDQDLTAVFSDTNRFMRWRVGLMEKGLAMLDFENLDQIVQVHDYEGVSLSSRTPDSKRAASEATKIFQNHYPETLYKKFFVNVPTVMTWIFWLFKPLIAARTLAKMQVLGSGPKAIGPTMLEVITPDQLPKRYGGEAVTTW